MGARRCTRGNANCPDPEGFDFDISHAPTLVNMDNGEQVLSFGGKSGVMYGLLLTDDGFDHLWSKELCKGGLYQAGVVHGISNDGKHIFAPCSQFVDQNGGWYSLDPKSGATAWYTPVDAHWGPVSSAGDLMFGGSWAGYGESLPEFAVLDSRTGEKVFTFLNEDPAGEGGPRSVMCAPSIVDGWVYWGSGYKDAEGTAWVYAFTLPEEMAKRSVKGTRITRYPGPPELKGVKPGQYPVIN
jgi:hypothetical protein